MVEMTLANLATLVPWSKKRSRVELAHVHQPSDRTVEGPWSASKRASGRRSGSLKHLSAPHNAVDLYPARANALRIFVPGYPLLTCA